MSRVIEVVPHNPAWKDIYTAEKTLLLDVFSGLAISIHHIGSTAIPGIKAKPVIDIMIIAQDIEKVDELNPAMIQLGYNPHGEYGIPGRRYFNKDTEGVRSHHVHSYAPGNPEIEAHLNFRDYLRAHPDEAQAYSQLKETLAAQYRHDSVTYTESKSDFVQRILNLASPWRKENPLDLTSD